MRVTRAFMVFGLAVSAILVLSSFAIASQGAMDMRFIAPIFSDNGKVLGLNGLFHWSNNVGVLPGFEAIPLPSINLFMPNHTPSGYLPPVPPTWYPGGGTTSSVGTLTGKVTVGPLTPVERVGVPSPIPNPEVFTSRTLIVFAADGVTKVADVPIKTAGYYGTYSVSLPPGAYVLDYRHQGMGRASPLPKQITIEAGKTTTVDVDIDTGIR